MKIQVIAKEPTKTTIFPRSIRVTVYVNSASVQAHIWDIISAQLNVYASGANIWTYRGFEYPWVKQTIDYDYCVTFFYQKNLMSALQYNDLRNRLRAAVRGLRRDYTSGLLVDLKGH